MKDWSESPWALVFRADHVHYFALCLIAAGLPLSRFLMSLGAILLFSEWLLSKKLQQRARTAFRDSTVLLLIAVFGLHLLGLLYTRDLEQGWDDVRIKLPLLLFPLVIGGREGRVKTEGILWVFFGAFLIASAFGYLQWKGVGSTDPAREASIFISPIRMSLMGCLSIAFALLLLARKDLSKWKSGLLALFALWSAFYLSVLATGISMVVLFLLFLFFVNRWRRESRSFVPLLVLVGIPVLLSSYIYWEVQDFFHVKEDPLNKKEQLEERTTQGNPYKHDTNGTLVENGYYVGLYVCEPELKKAWAQRSEMAYEGKDLEGNELRFTLLRYMSSKGLKKDAEGMGRMSAEDVRNVEKGVANIVHHRMIPPRQKFRATLFELERYFNGYDPSGNSVTQRFEFWRAGWNIIKENPWVGVGTGDLNRAFDRAYERIDSPLAEEFRLRAHQQFLSIWIAFGPFGLLLFILSLFLPPIWKERFRDPFYVAFFIVLFLSFFTEDTLESQAGVTLFAFWNALFLLGKAEGEESGRRF